MAVTSGTTYRFTNAQFPAKALNVYASGTTISARRNVCLYTNDTTDVMQQWVPVGNETDGYFLKCSANQNYALHYATGADSGSCVGNADVKSGIAKAPTEFLVDFIYLGNNQVKIKRRNSNEYLTAYNDAAPTSNTISTKTTNGNVYWTADDSLGNKQVWNISPSIDEEDVTEGQRLIMPINQSRITVSYKSNAPAYHEQGFSDPTHYGVDMVGTPRDFFASGDGTIVGYRAVDGGSLGKWLAVRYNNVIDIHGNNIGDVVFRYCHLDDIYKTSGEVHVDDASPMARYGSTGTGASSPHLHMEVDTDVEHPNKTPSLSGSSNGLVSGKNNDTTIDPFEIFYKRISDDEDKNQTVTPSQSYCDISNCSVCATQYPQYENGRVPYVNEAQCYGVPVLPE